MTRVDFRFSLSDQVRFVEVPDIECRIAGLIHNSNGNLYRVVWWANGVRYEEAVYEWELEAKGGKHVC